MYREPAPPKDATELDLDLPDAPGTAALGCAAASAMAGAALVGSTEIALVVGTGVLGVLGRELGLRVRRRQIEAMRAFLGPRVHRCERAFTSLDGARRVRFSSDDRHPRFERIDPTLGITLSSHRTGHRVAPPRVEAASLAIWHANVHGRCVNQVCFGGWPPELGGAARVMDVRLVRVRVFPHGVAVVRVTAGGASAGDTWHPTMDAATRQLDHELGAHVGPLRSGDRSAPVARPGAAWIH